MMMSETWGREYAVDSYSTTRQIWGTAFYVMMLQLLLGTDWAGDETWYWGASGALCELA